MNTHELADHLELCAKLLRSLPDAEVDVALKYIIDLVARKKSGSVPNTELQASFMFPSDIEEYIKSISPAEIEKYLTTAPEFSHITNVRELARRLGISGAKRQSHSAIVNMIVRSFEAQQMDSMIRGIGKDSKESS